MNAPRKPYKYRWKISTIYPVLSRKIPIPTITTSQIYQVYIRPIFIYAGPSWGPLIFRTNWKRILSVQNICFRTILAPLSYKYFREIGLTVEHFKILKRPRPVIWTKIHHLTNYSYQNPTIQLKLTLL